MCDQSPGTLCHVGFDWSWENWKCQSSGFSYRSFKHRCMRVNVESPRRLQLVLRTRKAIHEQFQRIRVTDLSQVAYGFAAWQILGNLSSTRRQPRDRPSQRLGLYLALFLLGNEFVATSEVTRYVQFCHWERPV